MKHTKRQYKATHRQRASKVAKQVERMAVYTLHFEKDQRDVKRVGR